MTNQTKSYTEADYANACIAVLEAAKQSKPNALIRYAATYARTGISMQGEERRVQCLYILNNLSAWRGDTAKLHKEVFKHFSKRK